MEKFCGFYHWFLLHNLYQRKFEKENLKKWKNYFPQSKVTTHCSLHPVVNWFGVRGKRSHWPCAMESLLLWGKSWVRLFILMTFNFYFFTQPCSANHKARNPITLHQWLLRHHNFELKTHYQKIQLKYDNWALSLFITTIADFNYKPTGPKW